MRKVALGICGVLAGLMGIARPAAADPSVNTVAGFLNLFPGDKVVYHLNGAPSVYVGVFGYNQHQASGYTANEPIGPFTVGFTLSIPGQPDTGGQYTYPIVFTDANGSAAISTGPYSGNSYPAGLYTAVSQASTNVAGVSANDAILGDFEVC